MNSIYLTLVCIMTVGLMAILGQAGITPNSAPASFFSVMAMAEAMALACFVWGNNS